VARAAVSHSGVACSALVITVLGIGDPIGTSLHRTLHTAALNGERLIPMRSRKPVS